MGLLFLYEAGGNAIPSPWTAAATISYYNYQDIGTNVSTFMCATGNLEYGDFLTYDENSNLIKAELDIATAEGYDAAGALYTADPDYAVDADDAISLQIEKAVSGYTSGIIGQIIGTNIFPKGLLDRVKTSYSGGVSSPSTFLGLSATGTMKTPGSATGGRTDQLVYANAAEKMVIVNLILR